MGPFVDAEHPAIKSGSDIIVENEHGAPMPLAYADIWSRIGACRLRVRVCVHGACGVE